MITHAAPPQTYDTSNALTEARYGLNTLMILTGAYGVFAMQVVSARLSGASY